MIHGRGDLLPEQYQKTTLLGGQAVIEGVMMRFGGSVATAVRRADGTIQVRKESYVPLADRYSLLKLPVLRGAVGLVEMLGVGIRALNFSAEVAVQDADPEAKPVSGGTRSAALGLTVVISFLAAIALFFALPLYVATAALDVEQQPFFFNLVAGGIRVTVFIGYLLLLSMMKDIYRLFQYHGAEHKTVFAMEQGADLTVAACRARSRFHPRCGTSFLLVVMVVAIVLFALLDAFLIQQLGKITLILRLATHLPLLPLVLGVAYEFVRFSARHADSALGRLVVAPGLWLQRITTKEPDDAQIEVAIAALRAAIGHAPSDDALERAMTAQAISVN
jgi:uncharacterized protein YqhQ